eukprot:CAMPEP_0118660616 /NCGR_PEP_ID=MMETSP0785-20121206/15792_1 /TAXON_ID=91992 /ORGANISM="Bolidomonas pacifica, Strain CCMP 1866" /LENGTH=264 /DNA_ID=CAMNT_0006553903 /DNA_START=127 /DNA_END=917 /DNA_ORIENTATION=+
MSAFSTSNTSNLRSLDEQRKRFEEEALAITSELNSGDNPAGVSKSLVDGEGFPRGDIDIFRVRSLRNRLSVLQTDHKRVMKEIEAALLNGSSGAQDEQDSELRRRLASKPRPKYDKVTGKWVVRNWDGSVAGIEGGDNIRFDDIGNEEVDRLRLASLSVSLSATSASTSTSTSTPTPTPTPTPTRTPNSLNPASGPSVIVVEPFAVIDMVSPNSPAADCGLRKDDVILKFGGVHFENHTQLRAIASEVKNAADSNSAIMVDVLR